MSADYNPGRYALSRPNRQQTTQAGTHSQGVWDPDERVYLTDLAIAQAAPLSVSRTLTTKARTQLAEAYFTLGDLLEHLENAADESDDSELVRGYIAEQRTKVARAWIGLGLVLGDEPTPMVRAGEPS